MTIIIGFAGKKQSGKNTMSNFMHGHEMMLSDVIEKFQITPKGELLVNCHVTDENGKLKQDMGIFDLSRKDGPFFDFASERIWPIIKNYSFADALKEVCTGLLKLTHEQCYGTDEQKNSITEINWEDTPGDHGKKGKMTAREVMQYVGTDIFRKMNKNVWIDATINQILSESSEIAVISDCRFENEADAIKAAGGFVVYLTRSITQGDSHSSENGFSENYQFDFVIDNQNMTIDEANEVLLNWLVENGITKKRYVPNQPVNIKPRFTSVKGNK